MAITIVLSFAAGYGGRYIQSSWHKNTTPTSPANPQQQAGTASKPTAKPSLISLSGTISEVNKNSFIVTIPDIDPTTGKTNSVEKITVAFDSLTSFLQAYPLTDRKTPTTGSANDIKAGYYVQVSYLGEAKAASVIALNVTYSKTDLSIPIQKK